jgi:hypothetical protein
MLEQFLYYRIGLIRVRVTLDQERGEPVPSAVELYDPKARTFTRAEKLMNLANSLDAVKIGEAEFFAP